MQSGGPGWNDPPQLTHQVHSETKTRRNLLNKRVAYLDQMPPDCSSTVTNFTSDIPPPASQLPANVNISAAQSPSKPFFPPVNIFVPGKMDDQSSTQSQTPTAGKSVTVTQEASFLMDNSEIDIFQTLQKLAERCKDSKNAAVTIDINKKLEALKSKLDDSSLSPEVVTKMEDMTRFLLNKSYEKAWDVHVSLMFDHISEVRLWMVGVKRLISELKKLDS